MKKVIILCIVILITFGSTFSVFATNNIDFKLSNAECSINRLVDIDIIASCNQNLTAATFEFTFDKSMFEFRSTKSVDSNANVKSNELDNTVKAVYLCADGTDISESKTIFTITFKAKKTGSGYIDFNVYECVDQNVEFIQVGTCTSARITVGGDSKSSADTDNNSSSFGNSNSSARAKSDDNNKSSNKQNSRVEVTTSQSSIDNLGTINPINDNKFNYILLGIFIGVGIVIVLSTVFVIGRKTAKPKEPLNKSR